MMRRDLFHERISKAIYYQFGAYQLHIELAGASFPMAKINPRVLTRTMHGRPGR